MQYFSFCTVTLPHRNFNAVLPGGKIQSHSGTIAVFSTSRSETITRTLGPGTGSRSQAPVLLTQRHLNAEFSGEFSQLVIGRLGEFDTISPIHLCSQVLDLTRVIDLFDACRCRCGA